MNKLKYTILFETGNDFEPTDSYTEIIDIENNLTNKEIADILDKERKIINKYTEQTGLKVWISSWEVYE